MRGERKAVRAAGSIAEAALGEVAHFNLGQIGPVSGESHRFSHMLVISETTTP